LRASSAVWVHTGHPPALPASAVRRLSASKPRGALLRHARAAHARGSRRPGRRPQRRRLQPALESGCNAERRGTCTARAREPRSTAERACFTTCPDATLACAAREVTLYLALPSLPHHRRSTLAFFHCAYSCFIPDRRRAAGKIESSPAMADPPGSHSTSNASPNLGLVGGPLADVAQPSVRSTRRVFVDPNAIRRSRLTLVHA
jgi:hypothetical protein